MNAPPVTDEPVETAEAEIDLVPQIAEMEDAEMDLDDTDGVFDLIDRRRVLLQVVFGVDVPPTAADAVFSASAPTTDVETP